MKIAIQTLRLTNNYGGILQAFALQNYLEMQGNEVVHLNRRPKTKDLILRLKIFIYRFINAKEIKISKQVDEKYRSFIQKFIHLSKPLRSKEEWDDYIFENKFDALIAGSDQIWRLEYNTGYTEECFLKYDKSFLRKVAYAASFGVPNDIDYPVNRLKELLSEFDGISVREKDAVSIVRKHYNGDVLQLIDPTLLLTAEDYIRIFNLKNDMEPNTIFAYILDKNDLKKNIINSSKEILGYELDYVYGSMVLKSNYKDPDIFQKPTIEQWLQKFLNSDFVITDSYHGMVFSLIFNKEFIIIGNEKRGVSRFKSLLEILNLENRLLMNELEFTQDFLSEKINWDNVNDIRKNLQNKAYEFLKNSLNL